MKQWFNDHGFKYVLLIVVLGLFYVYHDNIKAFLRPTPAPQISVQVPKQEVGATTTIIKEVAVEAPSKQGEVVSFVQRDGKVLAVIGDKEIEVPNMTGKPTAQLGKDGTLKITQEMQAKIDLTETIKAQALIIANYEVQKEAKEIKKKARAENWKYGVTGFGAGFAAGYAAGSSRK